jgi:hypothetical protein
VLSETDEKIRESLIPAVASAWAPKDPTAARAWAESIADPIVAQSTVTYIGSVIGWTDPMRGAEFLVSLPQTNKTRDALKSTTQNWADRDLDSALEWAARLENPALGDWVVDRIREKVPAKRREQAEQRWRELRGAAGKGGPR